MCRRDEVLDGNLQRLTQLGCASDAVGIAGGQPNCFHLNAGLPDGFLNLRHVPARVDDRRTARGLTPQQHAVLLERRDRDDRCAGFRLAGFWSVFEFCHSPHIADFSGKANRAF